MIALPNNNPCITDPPDVCYRVGTYDITRDLSGNMEGYIITAQINFRIYTLSNLSPGYGNVGATYTAEIPGTAQLPDAPANNSAQFTGNDLVVVCAGNDMKYSFAATDPDGDQLRYSFCNAWQTTSSGGPGGGGSNVYPQPPPYSSVPYGNGFDAGTPLGNSVQIDLNTGLITGIAPASGVYVVTVCVEEIRNGKVIARQRKDLQIKITACTIAAASLPAALMLCRNTNTLQLENRSQSPLIRTFYWEIRNRDATIAVFLHAGKARLYVSRYRHLQREAGSESRRSMRGFHHGTGLCLSWHEAGLYRQRILRQQAYRSSPINPLRAMAA